MQDEIQHNTPTGVSCCCLLDIALLVNRISLGLLFLLAGVGKIRMGVSEFYSQPFLSLKPPWLPDFIAWPFGHGLPFAELAVGALLLIGLFGRLASGLMVALLIAITIALWQKGMFFSGGAPFHNNVILLTLAFLLTVTGPGRFSVDRMVSKKCPCCA